ncbi:MAG: hypothetical protein RL660_2347 [Bacteroidota bacterium]|jgi:hypothetical protein
MRKGFTKFMLAATLALGFSQMATAQSSQVPHNCGTHVYYNDLYGKNPGLKEQDEAYEAAIADYLRTVDLSQLERTRSGEKIIPVVFHVIHDYGSEWIPDANIYDQMRILNEDFNKMNADTATIIPAFKSKIGDAKIKFMLAKKDPDGNCTNGIDRIQSYKTRAADDASKLNPWSRNYYFNVWVVNTIGRQGVAGYAYKPQSLNGGFLNMYDGIIILHDYVGSLPPASAFSSRALSHEFGHSFGLDHLWGSTNEPGVSCGDDGVADTPPTEGHSSCPSSALYGDSLCGGLTGPLENLQNFMEYSYCTSQMWTPGQCDKMQKVSFIDNNASRNLLAGALAHQVSGIFDTTVCPPKADFINRRYFTCVGTNNVNITGFPSNETAGSTYKWTMPNGTSNNATTKSLTGVTFNAAGWQPITFEVTSGGKVGSISKNNKVYVSDPAQTLPPNYTENFELTSTSDRWPVFNFYDNYFGWKVTDNGYLYGNCIKMNTFDDRPVAETFVGTPSGDADEFISPAWDLSGLTGTETRLSFVSAGATKTSAFADVTDSLRIYYSTNCGAAWTQLAFATVNKDNLFNMLQRPDNYEPQTTGDWQWRSYVIPDAAKSSATYFRFRYKSSDYSNNLFVDEISVGTWATGINDLAASKMQMSILPNPNNGAFNIRISQNLGADVDITDVTGKLIKTITAAEFNGNGDATINVNVPSGVYFASARLNGTKLTTQKFVVNN